MCEESMKHVSEKVQNLCKKKVNSFRCKRWLASFRITSDERS